MGHLCGLVAIIRLDTYKVGTPSTSYKWSYNLYTWPYINGSLGVISLPVITLCIPGSGAHLGSGVTGSHIFISNYRGTKVLLRRQPHLGFLTCWTFEKWRTPKFYPDIFLVDVYFWKTKSDFQNKDRLLKKLNWINVPKMFLFKLISVIMR